MGRRSRDFTSQLFRTKFTSKVNNENSLKIKKQSAKNNQEIEAEQKKQWRRILQKSCVKTPVSVIWSENSRHWTIVLKLQSVFVEVRSQEFES